VPGTVAAAADVLGFRADGNATDEAAAGFGMEDAGVALAAGFFIAEGDEAADAGCRALARLDAVGAVKGVLAAGGRLEVGVLERNGVDGAAAFGAWPARPPPVTCGRMGGCALTLVLDAPVCCGRIAGVDVVEVPVC